MSIAWCNFKDRIVFQSHGFSRNLIGGGAEDRITVKPYGGSCLLQLPQQIFILVRFANGLCA